MPEYSIKKVSDLSPRDGNPRTHSRTHSPTQIAQIKASIGEWGFTNPILIDEDGVIIAGHGRLEAADGVLDEVPTITIVGLTDDQKRALVIADNQLALNAGWDMDLLKVEITALDEFDVTLLGFDDDFIANLLHTDEGLTDPDEIPDAVEAVSKPGDVWILGNHRLLCGDSTSADDVALLMDGAKADICFTSPPYAQQRDYNVGAVSDWDELMGGVFCDAPVKVGGSLLVNLGMVHKNGILDQYWQRWLDAMAGADWPLFAWYVWDQGSGMPGNWNGRLAPSHEFIFHFAQKPRQANKWVDKKAENIGLDPSRKFRQKNGSLVAVTSDSTSLQSTKVADSVIRVNRASSQTKGNHPATFPTQLCEYIYRCFSKTEDIIYEPFSGSGTSIIACEAAGSSCRAMEIDPEYVDIAVKRWENYTGQTAERQDGQAQV